MTWPASRTPLPGAAGTPWGPGTKLYRRRDKLDKACQLLEKALANCKTELGSDHPDLKPYLGTLAVCYQAMGRLADAEPLDAQLKKFENDASCRDRLHEICHVIETQTSDSLKKINRARRATKQAVHTLEKQDKAVEKVVRRIKKLKESRPEAEQLMADELAQMRKQLESAERVINKGGRAQSTKIYEAVKKSNRCGEKIAALEREVQKAVEKIDHACKEQRKKLAGAQRMRKELEFRLEKQQAAQAAEEASFEKHYGEMFQEAFVLFDEDGSGLLDHQEMKNILFLLGESLDDEQFDELMREIDEDSNGVSCDEFSNMMIRRAFDQCAELEGG